MIQTVFNVIINMLASMIKIIVLPINVIITSTLPTLSDKITELMNGITTLFSGLTWGISALPQTLILTLLFIVSVEIARHTIFVSTHVISLVFDLIKKIKFW